MRRANPIFVWILSFVTASPAMVCAPAQGQTGRVVDRIVARIEGDIVLLSQVRELGAFQQLVEGRAESDDRLLAELVEQWMAQTEATESHFPQPAQSEVDREIARLTARVGSPEAYAAKLRELELSAAQVRQLLTLQIYVERYIDYKFRPTVQIGSADIQNYYQKELLPELAKNNQPTPRLAEVEGQIRELLTQRAITDLATKWLDETKSRLKIEVTLQDAKP
jgi:peptidyl-prolyl cis-trans isomerase SurA